MHPPKPCKKQWRRQILRTQSLSVTYPWFNKKSIRKCIWSVLWINSNQSQLKVSSCDSLYTVVCFSSSFCSYERYSRSKRTLRYKASIRSSGMRASFSNIIHKIVQKKRYRQIRRKLLFAYRLSNTKIKTILGEHHSRKFEFITSKKRL